jgi:hypothetical protein
MIVTPILQLGLYHLFETAFVSLEFKFATPRIRILDALFDPPPSSRSYQYHGAHGSSGSIMLNNYDLF